MLIYNWSTTYSCQLAPFFIAVHITFYRKAGNALFSNIQMHEDSLICNFITYKFQQRVSDSSVNIAISSKNGIYFQCKITITFALLGWNRNKKPHVVIVDIRQHRSLQKLNTWSFCWLTGSPHIFASKTLTHTSANVSAHWNG